MNFKIFSFWILSLMYFVSDLEAKCTGGKYPSNMPSKYDDVIHPPKYPSKNDDVREKNKLSKNDSGKHETKAPLKEGDEKHEPNSPTKNSDEKHNSNMSSKLLSKEGDEKHEPNMSSKNGDEKHNSNMLSKPPSKEGDEKQGASIALKNGDENHTLNVSSKHGEGKYVDDKKVSTSKPLNDNNIINDLTIPSAIQSTTTVQPNHPSAKHQSNGHPASHHSSSHHSHHDKSHPNFEIEETTDKQTKCYNSCSWCHAKTTLRKVKSQKEFKRCISLCAKENQCEPEFETCLRFSDATNGITKCAKHWKNCAKKFCFK
ncbi:uncharacterized protein DDB_G0281497 [Hydra vulgaris]|uniref:Uncharacterized protein DDB_G0281497 n=1 Tax=Hydra vulgaris TaxID=6087 RepID=A0ABM4CNA2_HYDVU